MGCIDVASKVLNYNMTASAKVLSQISISLETLSGKIAVNTILKDFGYNVYAICKNDADSIRARVVNGGITVTACLVCSVGPKNYYYLLVDEGYLLTVNGEYFMVEKDESLQ